jgi:hypothetical protein
MSTLPESRDLDRPPRPGETPASTAEVETAPGSRCHKTDADEPLGGDPPCWAHLFEDDLTSENR